MPFTVYMWVPGRSLGLSYWKLVRSILFLYAACQLCTLKDGFSWTFSSQPIHVVRSSHERLPLGVSNPRHWVLSTTVFLFISYCTTVWGEGGRNYLQVVSQLYQEVRKKVSQLLVIQLCNKDLVMEELNPATYTNLKQFVMLSSDTHLYFSLNPEEIFAV